MDWVRGETIGHGTFGKVSLAVPRKQSTLFFPRMVVKSSAASCSATLMNEKIILDELKGCPQIINCLGYSYTYENGEKLYNVLMEYASGGALWDKLKKSGKLPEIEVKSYTKALLQGLQYIHKSGYVHCDLKLQNILLAEEDGQVKIGDFGLAKRVNSNDKLRCELRGTPLYMSPEMVTRGEQGTPSDIWALGCVVAEMVTGVPVWTCADNITQLLMTIGVSDQSPQIPENLSDEGQDFLTRCFVKDPRKRWTAEMLLNHPFIAEDQDYNDTVRLNDETCDKCTPSTSPRCPFDFPDWVSDEESTCTCEITSLPSPAVQQSLNLTGGSLWSIEPAERLRGLVNEPRPESDWSYADGWLSVR